MGRFDDVDVPWRGNRLGCPRHESSVLLSLIIKIIVSDSIASSRRGSGIDESDRRGVVRNRKRIRVIISDYCADTARWRCNTYGISIVANESRRIEFL